MMKADVSMSRAALTGICNDLDSLTTSVSTSTTFFVRTLPSFRTLLRRAPVLTSLPSLVRLTRSLVGVLLVDFLDLVVLARPAEVLRSREALISSRSIKDFLLPAVLGNVCFSGEMSDTCCGAIETDLRREVDRSGTKAEEPDSLVILGAIRSIY